MILLKQLIVFLFVLLPAISPAASIKLTDEEREWIQNAPPVKTNSSEDFYPFDFNDNGKPAGYSIDYLSLIGEKSGLKFEFVQGKTWSEYKQFVEDKHIDMLHLASKTQDRERYLNYSQVYFIGSPTLLYARKSRQVIGSISQLGDRRLAVLRDGVAQRYLSQNYPQVKTLAIDSTTQGMNSLLKGEADYFLCYPSVCDSYVARKFLTNIEARGHLGIEALDTPRQAHFAVRDDWPILVSILNKAIASVTPEEKKALRDKWLDSTLKQQAVNDVQKLWLKQNKRLVYSQPKNYSPYSFVDEGGKLGGLASDLVKLFDKQYGVDSYYVDYASWTETYQALLDGEVDFIPTININEKRRQEVLMTKPVLTYNLTIFSHNDVPYFNNLDELTGYKVGVSKNSSVANLLRKNYPDLNFVTYKNGVDVYRALSKGEIDATASSPHVVYHTINEYDLSNIVASAETEFRFELAIAVHKSKPELHSLFNRMIDNLGEGEVEQIVEKWTNIKVVHRTDWQSIILWVLVITSLVVVVAVTLIALTKMKTVKILAQSDKRLTNAQRVAKIGNWELNSDRELVQISEQARAMLGIGSETVLTQEVYAQFINLEDRDGIKQSWKRALKTGRFQHEYRINIDDEEKWVREVAELKMSSGGQLQYATGIIQDITEQKLSELKIIQNESELRGLTTKLLGVQEEERKRVARELHDDLSQRLAALSLSVATIQLKEAEQKEKITAVKQDIISIANDIHSLSRRLHPSILDDLGLIEALRSEIKNYADREMIAVNFDATSAQFDLSKEAQLALFRITQESLRNIAKYSEATVVQVNLNVINDHLVLRVIDDGIGFDVKEAMRSPGLGLQSMTERAGLIKAELDIASNDEGTSINVKVPLQ